MHLHLHPKGAMLIVGAIICVALAGPVWASFNRDELRQQGEVYVVALHDAYAAAARKDKAEGRTETANFFEDKVKAIENGAELFPSHPTTFPIADAKVEARLQWAYAETFDVTTSEAADMEPGLVARVQINYERWLITMHLDPKDSDGPALQHAFEASLNALTNPIVS
jgi:hypothetical protein